MTDGHNVRHLSQLSSEVIADLLGVLGPLASLQLTQNSQAERMIDLGCDVLCVNMVDRSAASGVIDQAMESDIPIVFFNREPVAEDMNRWEKLYYVGADAKESAVLEGQILVDAYRKNRPPLTGTGTGLFRMSSLRGRRTTRIP